MVCKHVLFFPNNSSIILGSRYLTARYRRNGLKSMFVEFAVPTAWPVQCIIDDLEENRSSPEYVIVEQLGHSGSGKCMIYYRTGDLLRQK